MFFLPSGESQSKQTAASAPAEAPDILLTSKLGAYFFKQAATPTWQMPKNPQPAKEKFIFIDYDLYINNNKMYINNYVYLTFNK